MKRYIYSRTTPNLKFYLTEITSMVLVPNAFEFNPRDHINSISITSAKQIRKDYAAMSREQLLKLPKKELASISNIDVLRKLKVDELTLAQKVLVGQANRDYRDIGTKSKVKKTVEKLKECKSFFMWPTKKNEDFVKEVNKLGGEVDNSDVRKIVHSLKPEDFTEFRISYLDASWNSAMAVFEYKGDYTFDNLDEDKPGVEVKDLDLYIKIDYNTETGQGMGSVSFHHPEFKMNHPYAKIKSEEPNKE